MENIYAKIIQLNKEGIKSALCTLTETSGSVPRKAGSKMIVTENGEIFGTVGGGQIEQQIIQKATHICDKGHPEKFSFILDKDSGMQCGGSVEVFIEPLQPEFELVIFGAGHVGQALARLVKNYGFRVTLADNRTPLIERAKSEGFSVIEGNFVEIANELKTTMNSFLVVTTPKHKYDEEVTGILAKKSFRYLGMIGSRKKVELAIQNYRKQNILSNGEIKRIDMPIGIRFNAQTPEEIAVSILAKLIDVKNG